MYLYDESKSVALPEFLARYRHRLPLLVIITGGYNGETVFDDFGQGQVLCLHSYTRQRRVIANQKSKSEDRNQEYNCLSIPVDTPYKFYVDDDVDYKVRKPHHLATILQTSSLPIRANIDPVLKEVVIGSNTKADVNQLHNLVLLREYEENFMYYNSVQNGIMDRSVYLIAASPHITCTVITGFTTKSDTYFKNFLQTITNFIASNKRRELYPYRGNPRITNLCVHGTGTGCGLPVLKPPLLEKLNIQRCKPLPEETTMAEEYSRWHKVEHLFEPPLQSSNGGDNNVYESLSKRGSIAKRNVYASLPGRSSVGDNVYESIRIVPDSNSQNHIMSQKTDDFRPTKHQWPNDSSNDYRPTLPPRANENQNHSMFQKADDHNLTRRHLPNDSAGDHPPTPPERSKEDSAKAVNQGELNVHKMQDPRAQSYDRSSAERHKKYEKIWPEQTVASYIDPSRSKVERPDRYSACTQELTEVIKKRNSYRENQDLQYDAHKDVDLRAPTPYSDKSKSVPLPVGGQIERVGIQQSESFSEPKTTKIANFYTQNGRRMYGSTCDESVRRKWLLHLSVSGVSEQLQNLELDKYIDKFAKDLIDGSILSELDKETLQREYNFKTVEAIRLMQFVQKGHMPM